VFKINITYGNEMCALYYVLGFCMLHHIRETFMKFILGFVQHRGYNDQYAQELNSSYCFDYESTLTNLV